MVSHEQVRFSSNSGVYRVGFGNRDKGGVLMTQQMIWCLVLPIALVVSAYAVRLIVLTVIDWNYNKQGDYDDENQS